MVPTGCTGLVQPLDDSVNKPWKDILHNILEDALDTYEKQYQISLCVISKSNTVAIAQRRILVTWAVDEGWEQFCLKHRDLIHNYNPQMEDQIANTPQPREHVMESPNATSLLERQVEGLNIEFVDHD
ncbi:hypothetical protein HOY82DRAFT_618422 [Tuber indicum]|nr:hypothetical protein HOY82DRAFT_618422 [Tuber indicum]